MTQSLQNPQYDAYNAVRTRISSIGLSGMPTAGPFPSAAQVVALHGGLEYDIVSFVAVRRGEPPYVPAPNSANINRVYLRGAQSAAFPVPDVGGIMNYVVSGWYLWLILAPEGLESAFMIGNMPFPGIDQNEALGAKYFSYHLINEQLTRQVNGLAVPNEPPPITLLRQLQVTGGD